MNHIASLLAFKYFLTQLLFVVLEKYLNVSTKLNFCNSTILYCVLWYDVCCMLQTPVWREFGSIRKQGPISEDLYQFLTSIMCFFKPYIAAENSVLKLSESVVVSEHTWIR